MNYQFQSVTYIKTSDDTRVIYGAFDEVLPEGATVISGLIERVNQPVLERLLGNVEDVTPAQFRDAISRSGDTVKKFIEDRVKYTSDGGATGPELWGAYVDYCKSSGLPIEQTQKTFIRRFKKVSGTTRRVGVRNGKTTNIYQGVTL